MVDIIDEVIDRDELGIPDEYLPLARGAAIASVGLLLQAHHDGGGRPSGWHKGNQGRVFSTVVPGQILSVASFGCSRFWSIHQKMTPDILVFEFGSTPMLTRSEAAAMRLAMHCHLNGPPTGLRWNNPSPQDLAGALQTAKNAASTATLPPNCAS